MGILVRTLLALLTLVVGTLTAAGTSAAVPTPLHVEADAMADTMADAEVRTRTVTIGRSTSGTDITAVHRWRPGASKRVLVIGSMHGDEPAGTRVVDRLETMTPPANVHLWLVRSINPDGLAASTRTNARGVDLNRNFSHRWKRADRGTSTYSGPRAASEPETRALQRFVKGRPPRTTVSFHQPLRGVDSYAAKSLRVVRALSRETGLPVESFDCGGVCHGTFTGWHNRAVPGRAVTVEFGAHPSADRIRRTARAVLRVGSDY